MRKNIGTCDRCESKIIENPNRWHEGIHIHRHCGENVEEKGIHLCTMCLDELWQWAEGEDIDRSQVADPEPLDRLAKSVDRHITELKTILHELENAKETDN